MSYEFWTMKELGQVFGVSSHVIGRELKDLGLRTDDGRPSQLAFDGGYCGQRWTDDHVHYCWAWERQKTMQALEAGGLRRATEPSRAEGANGHVTAGQTAAAAPGPH
jgi:hypothetical protein